MLRLRMVFACMVLGVMLATGLAYAQDLQFDDPLVHQRHRPYGMVLGLGQVPKLLTLPQVQKELNLSDEQKGKITKWLRQVQTATLAPNARPPGPPVHLSEVLRSEQVERLRGINLQALGAAALAVPRVVDELGITHEQQEELSKLAGQTNERIGNITEQVMKLPPIERWPKQADLRRKIKQKAAEDSLGVLTPTQRQKWQKMTGKKIDLSGPSEPPPNPGLGVNPNPSP
jgi:hypothetical protein